MKYEPHDTVVLISDLPAHGLQSGDLGAVVDVRSPDTLDVEFILASGGTTALVTLKTSDVRAIADTDVVAVRSIARSA